MGLFLIYVNELGEDWKGDSIYEFIFSDTLDNIEGVDWDIIPASGQPEPPNVDAVRKIGKLESNLKFEVIQNDDKFSVLDAVDGLVALAWEDLRGYDIYPEYRTFFRFGMTEKEVDDILYKKDLILESKKIQKTS